MLKCSSFCIDQEQTTITYNSLHSGYWSGSRMLFFYYWSGTSCYARANNGLCHAIILFCVKISLAWQSLIINLSWTFYVSLINRSLWKLILLHVHVIFNYWYSVNQLQLEHMSTRAFTVIIMVIMWCFTGLLEKSLTTMLTWLYLVIVHFEWMTYWVTWLYIIVTRVCGCVMKITSNKHWVCGYVLLY